MARSRSGRACALGSQSPGDLGRDRLGEAVGRFLSSQVARADALAQQVERGILDGLADRDFAELVEQERECQEDRRGVGQVFAGDIGAVPWAASKSATRTTPAGSKARLALAPIPSDPASPQAMSERKSPYSFKTSTI